MKQHITKEQLRQLGKDRIIRLIDILGREKYNLRLQYPFCMPEELNNGVIDEFTEEDLETISRDCNIGVLTGKLCNLGYLAPIKQATPERDNQEWSFIVNVEDGERIEVRASEVCDALWETFKILMAL